MYDKFHVLGHLGKAMDKVRKQEYARLSGKDRRFIKGQKYHLLTRWENLSTEGKQALKLLFRANKRLNKAYLLQESFGQLWDYNRPAWARRFFDNWRSSLRWQRLGPFQKFADRWKLTGTVSRPTATWRTRCPWDSSRDSTTRSVLSNVGPSAIEMRSTFD